MSRKHFEALAKEIAALPGAPRRRMAKAIALLGTELNQRFDAEQWFRACNVHLSEKERHEFYVETTVL